MFNKNKVDQKRKHQGIYHQTKGDGSFDINIFKINFTIIYTQTRLLSIVDTIKATIPNPMLIVNIFQLTLYFLTVIGKIKAAANHPAAMFTKNSDRIWIKTILLVYHIKNVLNGGGTLIINQKGLMKLTKKTLITTLGVWIVIVSSGLLYLFGPWNKSAEAAWFSDDWAYRKAIVLTDSASETNKYATLSSYDASDSTKYQADCGDVRFTDAGGNLLVYTVASCGASTTFHINKTSMINGTETIYLYYGNPSVANGFTSADPYSACATCTFGSPASEEKAPSPIAYWKFDDATGTTAQDTTTTNADATLTGSPLPTWQTEDMCISGKCVYFGGSSSKATVATSVPGVQTVAFWVRPTAVTTVGLMDFDGGTHKISVSSGTISATGFTSPTIYVNGIVSSTLTTNQWQFVEITTGTGFTGSAIKMGFDNTNYLTGFMDDVKIYPYARSAAQVAADYNSRGNNEGVGASFGGDNQRALSNGLVGYWKMDENTGTTISDSSGNSNTSSAFTGNTAFTTGKFGYGLTFDGADDVVRIPESTSTDLGATTDSYTVAIWFKTTQDVGAFSTGSLLVKNGAGSSTSPFFLGLYGDETVNLVIGDGTHSPEIGSGTTYNDGSWHQAVGVRDVGTDKIYLYIDGVLKNSTADTTTATTANNDDISIGNGGASYVGDDFNGQTDSARIYNRALSSADVAALYNFAPGPVGYWNMDEGTGTTANDRSGNGKTATLAAGTGGYAPGKFGNAFDFTSNTSVIQTSSSFTPPTAITMETWINPRTATTAPHLIAILSGSDPSIRIQLQASGALRFRAEWSGGNVNYITTNTIPLNTWTHVAATYDGSLAANNPSLYINGVKQTSFSTATNTASGSLNTSATIWSIGNAQSGVIGIDGKMDDVKVYSYPRTDKQIIEDMNGGHPAPGSPVGSSVAYWKFDEGAANTCSGGANDACNSGTAGSTLDGAFNGNAAFTNSGKFGKALTLDGTGDYVTAATTPMSGNMSISTWVKASSWSYPSNEFTVTGIVGKAQWGGDANGDFRITILDTDLAAEVQTSSTNYRAQYATSNLTTGTWYYLTAVYNEDNKTIKLYVNGNEVNSSTTVGTVSSNSHTITIGAFPNNEANTEFSGVIDETKIFNAALTTDQIKEDMNRGSSQVLGALGDNSTYDKNAANQEYCVPGDTTSCAAPVGRWDFEEGTSSTANDTSGTGNTGTITGATWTQGKNGSGLNFNGTTSNFVNINDSNSMDITTTWTLETWVKRSGTTNGSNNDIIQRGTAPSGAYALYFDTSNRVSFVVQLVAVIGNSGDSITDTNWHHIALTRDSSNNYRFYIDGRLTNTVNSASAPTANSNGVQFGDSASNPFGGKMDQVRIFDYARTSAQVAWDYNRGGPVGWWKMDECQGTSANDSSGNFLTGTITPGAGSNTAAGTCTSGNAAHMWADGQTGKFNSSLGFDGTDDFVTAADNNILDLTSQVTLSAWINTTSGNFQPAFSKWVSGAANRSYALSFDSGAIYMEITNGAQSYCAGTGATTIPTGTWVHLVGTFNAGTYTIYKNGVPLSVSVTGACTDIQSTTATLDIGREGGVGVTYFTGQIDDVRVYNYVLTPTQVKQVYNQGGAVRFGPSTGSP